jgi:hypothetical protein
VTITQTPSGSPTWLSSPQKQLADAGISESLLEILQHVNQAIPEASDPDQGCAVYFGSYVFLRRGGQ